MGEHWQNPMALAKAAAPPGAIPIRVLPLPEGFKFVEGGIDCIVDEKTREFVWKPFVAYVQESALVGGNKLMKLYVGELARMPITDVAAVINPPPSPGVVAG